MEITSLFQQFGIAPLEVLDRLIQKSQEILTDEEDVTSRSTCEELMTIVGGIKELFASLTETNQTNKALKILPNVCGRYLKRCLNRDVFINGSDQLQVTTSNAIAELFTFVAPSIAQEKATMLQEVIDMVLRMLKASNVIEATEEQVDSDTVYSTLPLELMAVSFLSVLCSDTVLLHRLFSTQPDYDRQILQIILSVLKFSSLSLSYRIAGQILPHIIQKSISPSIMAGSVWEFICSVWSNQTTVEINNSDIVLTLLCCLHHLYINSTASLFSSNDDCTIALVDVRVKCTFWNIIQNALTNQDPLSRKRGMFLLHKALCSVNLLPSDARNSELGAGHSEEFVFWWGCDNDKECREVQSIWEGVVLLLETLEEKQVSN